MMEDKQKFDLESDFINYWNDVVRIWLGRMPKTCQSTLAPISTNRNNRIGENIYKDSFSVDIEDEQMRFFQHDKLRGLLCPAHMPEPYWGDPENCSIVIVDYNPGGGEDMSLHTYKGTIGNGQYPPNTMIKYVNDNSYSQLAKDFPIWKKELSKNKTWLGSYGGRDKFWLKKKKWAQHLVNNCVGEGIVDVEKCPPFAIELCGWHSPNWPNNTDVFKNDKDLRNTVSLRFVQPLLKAIENSKSQLAICIGAQFKPSILSTFLPQLENITKGIYGKMDQRYSLENYKYTYPDNPGKDEKNSDDSISVTFTSGKDKVSRYYRIYNVNVYGKDHFILNTFAPGGNRHPAEHFWQFEKILIEALKDMHAGTINSNYIGR